MEKQNSCKDTYREFLFNTYKPLVTAQYKKNPNNPMKKISQRINADFSKEVIVMTIKHTE